MRLINNDYGIEIEFIENNITVIVIENKIALIKILESMKRQMDGMDGDFILSEKDKQLKLDKKCEIIIDPFSIDVNNKKIIAKIHKDLDEISKNELLEEQGELNSMVVKFLDKLSGKLIYNIDYNIELDMPLLFKLYNVKIKEEEMDFYERIITYIKLMHQICNIELFVFYNLKDYFNSEKIELFYKDCLYEKINIIIIESSKSEKIKYEKYYILDNDLCIIEI